MWGNGNTINNFNANIQGISTVNNFNIGIQGINSTNIPITLGVNQPQNEGSRFTPEEDEKLKILAETTYPEGTENRWTLIAEHMPGRNAKQCRKRYNNYLYGKEKKVGLIQKKLKN